MADREIEELFDTRVEAVRKKDADLLLSTQVSEVAFAGSAGYLALKDLETEVLYTHPVSDLETIALVRESYNRSGNAPQTSFLLYRLTSTTKGWRIFGVQ